MPAKGAYFDYGIAGAGIVGLATARALLVRHPGARICVVERHATEAAGQSGHNSGVIHSGIYYAPGSLKARLCREGRARLLRFCRDSGVEFRLDGKLLVATSDAEVERLRLLHARGVENGLVGLEWLEADGIAAHEPRVSGRAALLVPEAGVVDFGEVCRCLREELESAGVEFRFRSALTGLRQETDRVEVRTATGSFDCGRFVACAGLYADVVAGMGGARTEFRVVPFRGEYWRLSKEAAKGIRALIYPVPDPTLPFLGVHLTRGVHGTVDAGPNAVLAFAREGYRRGDVDLRHLMGLATWPGAWKLAWSHRSFAGPEWFRSMSRWLTARALSRLVPGIRAADLSAAPSGVRAQLVDRDGRLVDDFRFLAAGAGLHVLNAPSPAATASLAIGEHVVDELERSTGR